MSGGHVLEVLHEEDVHCRPAGSPDHGNGLGDGLLGHGDAEAARYLGDQPRDGGSARLDSTSCREMLDGIGDGPGQGGPHGKVRGLGRIIAPGPAAQREDLDAGQLCVDGGEILSLAAPDVGDRA